MQDNDKKCGLIIHVGVCAGYLNIDAMIVNVETMDWIEHGGEMPANQLSVYAESCDISLEEAKKEVSEFKDDIAIRAYEAGSDYGIGNSCMDLVDAIKFIQDNNLEVLTCYEIESEPDENGVRLCSMYPAQ